MKLKAAAPAGTEPQAVAEVLDLAALQTLVDSQRHRLVTLLIEEPLTATELASKMRLGRTRLYYHLDLLEKHGIIRVVDERVVSGITERRYRAVARRYRVDRALLSNESQIEITGAQASILESVAADLLSSRDSDPFVARLFLRLNKRRRQNFRRRLQSLLGEFENSDADGDEVELSVALFAAPGQAT